MNIKTVKKSWSFDVDGQEWKVTFTFKSNYWHVTTNRNFARQFKDDGKNLKNHNKALFYLSEVVKEYNELKAVMTES
jgi:hypothetical protein